MKLLAIRSGIIAAVFMLIACGRGTDPDSSALIGEWEKLERSMPPVNLLITRDGEVLRGRMRLSGTESHCTITIDGTRITLHFANDATIDGDLLSSKELRLNMDLPVQTRLRKLNR
jgi:hypothetical protein